jgi:putative peptidoglycan lipid II flippase
MNGPVSWLAYAYRFFALPMGLFGVAIASAALPRLSHSAAMGNFAEFRETVSRSITMILLFTIPSSLGLAILGESMIAIVYQHGRFQAFDTHQTALALSCYAAGLAGYATMKLIAPAFYALGDARTPMVVSMASVLVNGVTAFTMVRVAGLGHAGLALSSSVVSTFGSLALLLLLRGKIGGVKGAEIAVNFLKIAAASGVMAGVCYAVVAGVHSHIPNVLIGVPAGVATFYWGARVLRVRELDNARAAILQKLRGTASVKISGHASRY